MKSNTKDNKTQNTYSQKISRWYLKQSTAVRAAILGSLIAGVFGCLAAIVGGIFDLSGDIITQLPKDTHYPTPITLQTNNPLDTETPPLKGMIVVDAEQAQHNECYGIIFPENFHPAGGIEMAIEEFGEILVNRGNHDSVNFETLDFTLTNTGFDGVAKLSNKIIAEILNYEPLPYPIDAFSSGCGGTGVARDFPVVIFTSTEIGSVFVERVSDIDFFTLSLDEFEVFHVDFKAQKPGQYEFRVGFEYMIKGVTQVIYTPATYQLWAPELLNMWGPNYGENSVSFSAVGEPQIFKDGKYISPNSETQKVMEVTPTLPAIQIHETISYVQDRNIWVQDLSSGEVLQITLDGLNSNPVWSPDGNFILFERYPNEDYYHDILHPLYYMEGHELLTMISQDKSKRQSPDLLIFNLTTGTETPFFNNACCSAWSPNGDKIALISLKEGDYYLVIVNFESAEKVGEVLEIPMRELISSESEIMEPISLMAWSPEDIIYVPLLTKNQEGFLISTVWGYDMPRKRAERLIEPTPLEGYAPGIGGIGEPFIRPSGMLSALLNLNYWGVYNPVADPIIWDSGQWRYDNLPEGGGSRWSLSQDEKYGASQHVSCYGIDGVTDYCQVESRIYDRERMEVILRLENIFNIAWMPK